jgi:hypothetical protein
MRSEARNLENFGKTERSRVPGGLTESRGFMKSRYCGLRTRRVKAQNLTAKEKEKYFISLYVKEGAVEEKITYAERRASLKPAGHKILRHKKVQEEIKARMEPVRLGQMRWTGEGARPHTNRLVLVLARLKPCPSQNLCGASLRWTAEGGCPYVS